MKINKLIKTLVKRFHSGKDDRSDVIGALVSAVIKLQSQAAYHHAEVE